MNYLTTVDRQREDDETILIPLEVSPGDFPLRIRTNYKTDEDLLELFLDFQRGNEAWQAREGGRWKLDFGKVSGRIYHFLIRDFLEGDPSIKSEELLGALKYNRFPLPTINTFEFCLDVVKKILDKERSHVVSERKGEALGAL